MSLEHPKKNLMPIVLGIFALAIWGHNSYSFFQGVASADDMDDFQMLDSVRSTVAGLGEPNRDTPWVYDDRNRDPFENWLIQKRPQTSVKSEKRKKVSVKRTPPLRPPKLRLTGVITDSLGGLAVIEDANQQIFFARQGDSVAGVKIVSVASGKIDCEYREQKFTLRLK